LFIVGLLSVPIREEFGGSRAALGLAVSAFMGAAVISAPFAGRAVDRYGVSVVLRLGIASVLLSDLWVGVISSGPGMLRVGMAFGGLGLALVDAGSTLDVSQEVRHESQAMAFGIKEIAGPLTTLLGGVVLLPIAAATSWRAVFLLYSAIAAGLLILDLSLDREHGDKVGTRSSESGVLPLDRARGVSVAVGLAMVGVTAVTTYGIDASVVAGLTEQTAGLWITVASIGTIGMRIGGAYVAGRSEPFGVLVVVGLILVGGLSHLVLASGSSSAMGPGAFLSLIFGWGWGGILFLFVIRLYPFQTGRATGIVFMGTYAGGVLGPPTFGWIVDQWGFRTGWFFSAGCMVMAALILAWALAPLRARKELQPT
jgi:MFS family permease